MSFLAGAAHSGFRAARALGSKHVASEADEVVFPEAARWGQFGVAALAAAAAVGVGGRVLGGTVGVGVAGLAVPLFGLTALWPRFLPPHQSVYKALFGGAIALGAVAIAAGIAR